MSGKGEADDKFVIRLLCKKEILPGVCKKPAISHDAGSRKIGVANSMLDIPKENWVDEYVNPSTIFHKKNNGHCGNTSTKNSHF